MKRFHVVSITLAAIAGLTPVVLASCSGDEATPPPVDASIDGQDGQAGDAPTNETSLPSSIDCGVSLPRGGTPGIITLRNVPPGPQTVVVFYDPDGHPQPAQVGVDASGVVTATIVHGATMTLSYPIQIMSPGPPGSFYSGLQIISYLGVEPGDDLMIFPATPSYDGGDIRGLTIVDQSPANAPDVGDAGNIETESFTNGCDYGPAGFPTRISTAEQCLFDGSVNVMAAKTAVDGRSVLAYAETTVPWVDGGAEVTDWSYADASFVPIDFGGASSSSIGLEVALRHQAATFSDLQYLGDSVPVPAPFGFIDNIAYRWASVADQTKAGSGALRVAAPDAGFQINVADLPKNPGRRHTTYDTTNGLVSTFALPDGGTVCSITQLDGVMAAFNTGYVGWTIIAPPSPRISVPPLTNELTMSTPGAFPPIPDYNSAGLVVFVSASNLGSYAKFRADHSVCNYFGFTNELFPPSTAPLLVHGTIVN